MKTETISVALDGITRLPPGHVAAIKSYLERRIPYQETAPPLPQGMTLLRLTGADHARYKELFRRIGQRWLWWSRLLLADHALAAVLDQTTTEAFVLTSASDDIGLLEWDFSTTTAPELAFLGLVESAIGQGLGDLLMARTLARMFREPIASVRLNTCTFDHPGALSFYRRWGFAVTAQAVEIVPDPRLSDLLPREAAPHVPLLLAPT